MCTLSGHLTAGLFMLAVGMYWAFSVFRRYYKSLGKGSRPFCNSCFYPWRDKYYLDGYLVVFGCSAKVAVQVLGNYPEVSMHNQQHIAIYAFGGTVSALALASQKMSLKPEGAEFILMALTKFIQALVMSSHHLGVEAYPPEGFTHELVSYNGLGIAISFLMELALPHNVFAGLSRSFFVVLEGLWLAMAAFYLYPVDRSWNTHELKRELKVMLVPILYTVAVLLAVGVMFGIWTLTYRRFPIQKWGPRDYSDNDDVRDDEEGESREKDNLIEC